MFVYMYVRLFLTGHHDHAFDMIERIYYVDLSVPAAECVFSAHWPPPVNSLKSKTFYCIYEHIKYTYNIGL